MEKLTEYVDGKYIRIKGTKSLYPKNERDGAPLSNAIARLAAYEETGLEPEELAQAEKEGRLVVLPFSVAKHIYRIVDMKSHSAYNDFVTCERVLPFGIPIESILGGARIIPIEQFGKTVFLTREAAEAALEEREAEYEQTD